MTTMESDRPISSSRTAEISKIEELLNPDPKVLSTYKGFCESTELNKAFKRIHQAQKKQ